ncbi:MAG: ParA family protein [Gammaproteobacteria bacterium]|nr:ParA family protein [Gammaproteobacteria bacterium]
MRRIMVLNPKGGSGKSTLATNLAAFYAKSAKVTHLLDLDPQRSCNDWLAQRPKSANPIIELRAEVGEILLPHRNGVMIIDTPAAIDTEQFKSYVKTAHVIIIPVLPSPIDIRATARTIERLLLLGRISKERTRIAVVANRVREKRLAYRSLQKFLQSLEIPFIATLHDSECYIYAMSKGLGIFELPKAKVGPEVEQWVPLLKWLKSKASQAKE